MFVTADTGAGTALILAGVGSMALAAVVLFISNPTKRSAAIKQGALPVLAIVTTLIVLI